MISCPPENTGEELAKELAEEKEDDRMLALLNILPRAAVLALIPMEEKLLAFDEEYRFWLLEQFSKDHAWRLANLDRDEQVLALPRVLQKHLSSDYLQTLSPTVQRFIFERLGKP